jgi:NitT/TauT family transport system ATP-binding protein
MMGLLVLLNSHGGDEEIARLADDLDLEIDEILPSVEYAEVLGLLAVTDGRAKLTEIGRKLLAGSINGRKSLLREQLKRTTLFRALLRALESAPERRLTDEQVNQLIAFTTAPADSLVQNIINWGRYAEMFRYDSDEHLLLPTRVHATRSGASRRPPTPPGPEKAGASSAAGAKSKGDAGPAEQLASFA